MGSACSASARARAGSVSTSVCAICTKVRATSGHAPDFVELDAFFEHRKGLDAAALIGEEGCRDRSRPVL